MEISVGDQLIRFDLELTRAAYAALDSGVAEKCGCPYCRNFAMQRSTAYPETFRRLLDQLGVDLAKEGDLHEEGAEDTLVRYGGWFYLAGELIQPGERLANTSPDFQYFFRVSHKPRAMADFEDEVLALEFTTKLPWILSEQPPPARSTARI